MVDIIVVVTACKDGQDKGRGGGGGGGGGRYRLQDCVCLKVKTEFCHGFVYYASSEFADLAKNLDKIILKTITLKTNSSIHSTVPFQFQTPHFECGVADSCWLCPWLFYACE